MHDYDATGIEATGGNGFVIPTGTYDLAITGIEERKTQKGDYMVNVKAMVVNHPEFNGKSIYQNVTFMPKNAPGSGMAIHFLKTIGMPYEGRITVDPLNWIGTYYRAKVGTSEYKGKVRNEVLSVEPISPVPASKADSDLPF